MKFKYLLFVFIITSFFKSFAQSPANAINLIRIKHRVPELAYAVVRADKVLYSEYLGYHQLGENNKADTANAHDYFHLGSNTKAITGFIAAYLVEQHKINWDTKFFDLFPEALAASNKTYSQITLENLLSHRANIQAFTSGKEFKSVPHLEGSVQSQRQQFARYALNQKAVASKEVYSYSNAGYAIAATMLEKASGKSWEELVLDILNKKLGLHAKFGWPNKIDNNQPYGHWEENGKLVAVPGNTTYNLKYIEPAGDISITLPDYIKFIQLNLQGLAGANNLLHSSTYQFLHYGLKEYAIGWANDGTEQLSEHDGSAGTFYCRTVIEGKKNIAYIIIANAANQDAQNAIDDITTLLKRSKF